MSSRLFIRLLSNFKYLSSYFHSSPSPSNEKISRAFIISPHQYGSFRLTHIPSPLLNRSDSLFSRADFQIHSQPISSTTTNQITLLEHYLKSYNPLKIDLTNVNEGTVRTSIVKQISPSEEAISDTDTRPMRNCYPLNCTNKQKIVRGGRYVRLEEQENCSATRSILDDRLSDCSTKFTSITLPTLMVTDCSDQQRLHTDIIELNEDEKDNE